MKFAALKSVAHNIATAVSDGGFGMFGTTFDIHGEAAKNAPGYILVDFRSGAVSGSPVSAATLGSLSEAPNVLADLCRRHGGDASDIAELTARFGIDPVYGPHFTVTVANQQGKRSIDQYKGVSGRRIRGGRRTDNEQFALSIPHAGR